MDIKPFLDGWGDVVGSIIGGIITFIGLFITIKYNNKIFKKNIENDNFPLLNNVILNKKNEFGILNIIDITNDKIILLESFISKNYPNNFIFADQEESDVYLYSFQIKKYWKWTCN